jgi:hypothetical protein
MMHWPPFAASVLHRAISASSSTTACWHTVSVGSWL